CRAMSTACRARSLDWLATLSFAAGSVHVLAKVPARDSTRAGWRGKSSTFMNKPQVSVAASSPAWGLGEFFIISQTAIPALLFLPGTQPIRLFVRVASFAISIALLVWWMLGTAKDTRRHPSQPWLLASMIYVAAMIAHPFTSSLLAGVAQVVLYVAV